ncbi:reverse transcriptase domain-containing protein [Tanacetum coccineum]
MEAYMVDMEEYEEEDFQNYEDKKKSTRWRLYSNGSSRDNGSGADLMIVSPEGMEFTYALKFKFKATNNEDEYKGAIAGPGIAKEMKIEEITVLVDSQLVANQVADVAVEEEGSWMTPIREYLISRILPADKKLTRKIRVRAPNYQIIDRVLYKRSFLSTWLRCMGSRQARSVIKEIHKGSCGLHAEPRSIVAKVTTFGYYWPSMHMDAIEVIQSCDACQIHSPISRLPKQDMTLVTATWLVIQWGINIVGLLPEALGKVKFIIVAIDYFTKWVEAKPLASITRKHVERFVWELIVCRFRLPQSIVSDNGNITPRVLGSFTTSINPLFIFSSVRVCF